MATTFSPKKSTHGSQVSAFAVYKNLIPGLKVYEDHNSSLTNSAKKKKKKMKSEGMNGDVKVPSAGNSPKQQVVPPRISEFSKKAKHQNQGNPPGSPNKKAQNDVAQFIEAKAVQLQKEKEQNGIATGKKRKLENGHSGRQSMAGVSTPAWNHVVEDEGSAHTPKQKKKKPRAITPPPTPPQIQEELIVNGIGISKGKSTDDLVVASRGKNSFKWLIGSTTVPDFFSNYWEKKPLLVKRENPEYYGNLLNSAMLDTMLRNNIIRFGKNIDVTSYTDGKRETHNPSGRAMPPVVWDYYANGCSIRLLNPQTYIRSIWKLNSSLQDYVGTFVGANVYLTPPKSQGFAPHWDDIEAFVLQLEGSKRWRLYEPLEQLPKASSANLTEDVIGKPILDVILKPGDLLYFPRGYIHQANAMREHSLHITLSCFQNNSYSDFLKEYLPMALDHATMENVSHREGLPRDYLQYMGVAHADREELADKRAAFIRKIRKLSTAILDNTMIDFAADQMGKRVIWDSLPPFVEGSEISTTVSSNVNHTMEKGTVSIRNQLNDDTEIRMLRSNCVRLVIEDGVLRLYYSTENSLEYHGEEPLFLEMVEEAGPAIEYLIAQFPHFVKIEDLPLDDDDLKFQIAKDLWEKGILRTRI